jgi:hypothetical protein
MPLNAATMPGATKCRSSGFTVPMTFIPTPYRKANQGCRGKICAFHQNLHIMSEKTKGPKFPKRFVDAEPT